jgi:hypothetical protein
LGDLERSSLSRAGFISRIHAHITYDLTFLGKRSNRNIHGETLKPTDSDSRGSPLMQATSASIPQTS